MRASSGYNGANTLFLMHALSKFIPNFDKNKAHFAPHATMSCGGGRIL